MTNSNLYAYMKKLFPDRKPVNMTGRILSKEGTTLIIEDTSKEIGRKTRVKNFTGNDYATGTVVFISDGIVIGRASSGSSASIYVV